MEFLKGKGNLPGKFNGNWKGGISRNHYHYKKLQKQRYPERIRARAKVHRAIRSGRLKRQPCEYCGATENICAHITDYEKPLEGIIWVCRPCNRKHHHNGKY